MAVINASKRRSPRHVTIVGSLPPLLGISAYCKHFALALANLLRVEFLSYRNMYPQMLYPGSTQIDATSLVPQHSNLEIRRALDWYNPPRWIYEGARLNCNILHLQWWSLPLAPIQITLAGIARRRQIKVVTTVHNVTPHEVSRGFELAMRAMVSTSNTVIVHNKSSARALRHRYGDINVQVVPHGTLTWERQYDLTRDAARGILGPKETVPIILCFGNLRPYKGLEDALDALCDIRKHYPEVILVIAGKAWGGSDYWINLVKTKQLTQNVRLFLGSVSEKDVPAYFRAADLALLPYREFAGQSGVGMLSLGAGLPIVVTDVGSLPDLVIDKKSIVPPGNTQALARRVLEILGSPDLRSRLKEDSRDLAKTYDWSIIADSTLRVYKDTLAADHVHAPLT